MNRVLLLLLLVSEIAVAQTTAIPVKISRRVLSKGCDVVERATLTEVNGEVVILTATSTLYQGSFIAPLGSLLVDASADETTGAKKLLSRARKSGFKVGNERAGESLCGGDMETITVALSEQAVRTPRRVYGSADRHIKEPKLLAEPAKPLPESDKRKPESGLQRASFWLVINEQGSIVFIMPQTATSDWWAEVALKSISQWKYRPATLDGKPVAASHIVDLSLDLH